MAEKIRMSKTDVQEFFKKSEPLFQYYQDGKYADALAVAEDLAVKYPERDDNTSYWRLCLYAVTGQREKALQAFDEALKRGVWWAEERLRSDSDLDSLQGDPEFERLVTRSEEKHMHATAEPQLFVYQPDGTGPFPLLIVLHARSSSAERDLLFWKSAVRHNWMLAMPQSSQTSSPLSFVWDDREKSMNEIAKHLDSLIENYPIDTYKIVIAGFSQGAARAIELVMTERIKANGFIAVVPGSMDIDELSPWVDSAKTRGVLISGSRDPRYEMFQQIKEIFAQKDIPLMFENYPEMAHEFPNDFEQVLQKGLDFICS
jgi:predicted esterase